MLAKDPLRPASCVFRLCWLVLVCLVHLTDAWLDGDPGNLEVKSQRQILFCASQSIPQPFCHKAGRIILLEQAAAIREYCFPERVDMLCKCKSVGSWIFRPGFPPHLHQWALSTHEPFDIGNSSVLGPPTKAAVLTQAQSSCHHYLALVTHPFNPHTCPFFPASNTSELRTCWFFWAYLYLSALILLHMINVCMTQYLSLGCSDCLPACWTFRRAFFLKTKPEREMQCT